jgi:hypothetical protein
MDESETCIECGAAIPPHLERCPVCGWSWTDPVESVVKQGDQTTDQAMPHSESASEQDVHRRKRRWIKHAPLIVSILALILTNVYNWANLAHYREQQTPELDCRYEYNGIKDSLGFRVSNVGLVDARSVWATESIFMIINGKVYEGTDVPHFNYIVCGGSRDRMWDIPRRNWQPVELPKYQHLAFVGLMKRFQTEIVSKWAISYSPLASSKRFSREEYFLHDLSDAMPRKLTDITGGPAKRDRITAYIASGPRHEITICDLTDDFELDAPSDYRVTKDYSVHPVHPYTRLSIEEINNTRLWSMSGKPQVADDVKGTLSYIWKHKDGKWSKWTSVRGGVWTTQPFSMPQTYLNPEDAERLKLDPTLLTPSKYDPEIEKQIREKAREKFIRMREE